VGRESGKRPQGGRRTSLIMPSSPAHRKKERGEVPLRGSPSTWRKGGHRRAVAPEKKRLLPLLNQEERKKRRQVEGKSTIPSPSETEKEDPVPSATSPKGKRHRFLLLKEGKKGVFSTKATVEGDSSTFGEGEREKNRLPRRSPGKEGIKRKSKENRPFVSGREGKKGTFRIHVF